MRRFTRPPDRNISDTEYRDFERTGFQDADVKQEIPYPNENAVDKAQW